jgi:hypothetical protein
LRHCHRSNPSFVSEGDDLSLIPSTALAIAGTIASPVFEVVAVGGVSGGHGCSRAGSEVLAHVAPLGRLVAA